MNIPDFKVHAYLDGKMIGKRVDPALPRLGDTVRLSADTYAKVAEVIWCWDEESDLPSRTRVNLRLAKCAP